jgi:hypothetical protein
MMNPPPMGKNQQRRLLRKIAPPPPQGVHHCGDLFISCNLSTQVMFVYTMQALLIFDF